MLRGLPEGRQLNRMYSFLVVPTHQRSGGGGARTRLHWRYDSVMKGLSLIVVLVLGAALVALPHFVSETTLARGLGDKVIVAIGIIFLVLVRIGR